MDRVIESIGRKNNYNRWDFKKIIVEIFPRKISPVYPKDVPLELKKYITWKTAHEDIEKQRDHGVKGIKYSIEPKLINLNKDKFQTVDALWDIRLKAWVDCEWRDYPCEIRKRRIPLEPKWEYKIISVERI